MLHMVMLGGNHPNAKIEVHDVVFINCDNIHQSHDTLRELWFGDKKRVHIDSWMAVHGVDGYQVELSDQRSDNDGLNLYFINLGGYDANIFGEEHRYLLVIAQSEHHAKEKAKQTILDVWEMPHKDNLFDIDDCLQLDNIEGLYIKLTNKDHQPNVFKNDYVVL